MRAYRISFNPKASKFVIEIQGFAGLYWNAAKDSGKVKQFDTFDDASAYVKNIGLSSIYTDLTFKTPFGTQRPTQDHPLAGIMEAYSAPPRVR